MGFKWWVVIAVILFGLGLWLGITPPQGEAGPLSVEVTALEQMADLLASLPPPVLLMVIFIKNASAVLISLALSPLFGVVPVLALIFNGWLLGFVAVSLVSQKSLGFVLAGILPHGLIELPAFVIGEAVALSFGAAVIVGLFNKQKRGLIGPNLRRNAKYLMISILLFLPAAAIETYVTPLLLR